MLHVQPMYIDAHFGDIDENSELIINVTISRLGRGLICSKGQVNGDLRNRSLAAG